MTFKFFTVPIQDSGKAEGELNGFLRSHKVLSVDRRWVEQVRLWDLGSGTEKQVFRVGPIFGHVRQIAFAADGRHRQRQRHGVHLADCPAAQGGAEGEVIPDRHESKDCQE